MIVVIAAAVMVAQATESKADVSRIELVIKDGEMEGGQAAFEVTEGEVVVIEVTTDHVADLHLHGYDIELHVTPREPGEMIVDTSRSGRFPLTLHTYDGSHVDHAPLLYLDVYPD